MVVGGGRREGYAENIGGEIRNSVRSSERNISFRISRGKGGGGGGEGIITITRACKPTNDDPSSCAGLS